MSKYDERLAQIKTAFDAKQAELTQIAEQRRKLDQRTAELNAELLQLKGAYDAVSGLKNDEEKATPPPVPVPAEADGGTVS